MPSSMRPFREGDLPRLVEIRNRNVPEEPRSFEQLAYFERTWDATRYERARLVGERDGAVVGWGEVAHAPWRFHPMLRINLALGFAREQGWISFEKTMDAET